MTANDTPALTKTLRQRIETAPSLYALAKESGIDRTRLKRFVRGERDLKLSSAEKLMQVFGLQIKDD